MSAGTIFANRFADIEWVRIRWNNPLEQSVGSPKTPKFEGDGVEIRYASRAFHARLSSRGDDTPCVIRVGNGDAGHTIAASICAARFRSCRRTIVVEACAGGKCRSSGRTRSPKEQHETAIWFRKKAASPVLVVEQFYK